MKVLVFQKQKAQFMVIVHNDKTIKYLDNLICKNFDGKPIQILPMDISVQQKLTKLVSRNILPIWIKGLLQPTYPEVEEWRNTKDCEAVSKIVINDMVEKNGCKLIEEIKYNGKS